MIHVIILAYRGDRWLPRCIESLATASKQKIHLTLVDNHGNKEIDKLDLSAFEAKVIRTEKVLGFCEGNNFGIMQNFPQGEFVVFLNQDTWGEDGWLDRCIEVLESQDAWGAVTPVLRKYDHTDLDSSFVSTMIDSHLDPSQLKAGNVIGAKHIPATAMVVKTQALLLAGPFDPVFGSYYEDYDLCRRIQLINYRVGIQPAAVVHHFSGSASRDKKANNRRLRFIHRNRMLHHFRMQKTSRIPGLLHYFFIQWPRNILRGLFRRKNAPPISVTVGVLIDILKRLKRFGSRTRDLKAWEQYLKSIDWPSAT